MTDAPLHPGAPSDASAGGVQVQKAAAAASVAVVIAAWRAADTIGRAVASALAQPEAAEILVVDDASGDDGATLAAARAADDGSGRLKLIGLTENGGPARARNVAIAASAAPWICVLDSDDYMEAGRLAALLAIATDAYDFVADDLMQTPEDAPDAGRPMWFDGSGEPQDISLSMFVRANIPRAGRMRRELGFLKPLMRRAWLAANAISYDEAMRLGEDYDLYARALAAGARFRLVPCAGYVSVMRANSLSAHHSRKDLAALEAADLRLLAPGTLSTAESRDVAAHLFSTRKRLVWIDVIAALKALNPLKAAWIALRDPRQAPHVIAGLGEIVGRRLTGARR